MASTRSALVLMAVAVVVFVLPVAEAAQQTGSLGGTVRDPTGLPLPGVAIEAREVSDDSVRTAVTDGAGAYALGELPPGNYDLSFTLAGFRTVRREAVAVVAGAAVTLDVGLPLQFEEAVVVVGSRAHPRSVTDSRVPIDAIPFTDVMSQGSTTLDYQLRTLLPSFNVATHPISDAATLVRPATLRNLAHDHTLVLVNGKRRHRSSVVAWFAGVTDGAQGPDISTIPAIALRQVEVLRDGASAQYGSDAIAGVLNFLLKDDRSGGSVEVSTGTYRAGDGDTYTVAGNFGLPLGAAGFANLSFEYGGADPTDRSVQRADAAALIAAGNDAVADPAQVWGNPTIDGDLKLFGNFGSLFAEDMQFYGHASYADKKVTRVSTSGTRTRGRTSTRSTAVRRCSSGTCSRRRAGARPTVPRCGSPTTCRIRRRSPRCSRTPTASPSRRSRLGASRPVSAASSRTCRRSPGSGASRRPA